MEVLVTTVRCYLPLAPGQLALLRDDRRLPGPLPATAVTEELRSLDPGADQEEGEYAAAQEAAGRLRDGGSPVIVAAVDLDGADVATRSGAWVDVAGVDLPRVAALHVGDDVVTGDPTALPAAGEELELSWFDTTELAHVIELVEAVPARDDGRGHDRHDRRETGASDDPDDHEHEA